MTDPKPVTYPITGRVPQEVLDWIQSAAEKRGISTCKLVSELVQDAYSSQQTKPAIPVTLTLPPCESTTCAHRRHNLELYPGGCLIYTDSQDNHLGNLLRCPDYCLEQSREKSNG